MVVVIQAIVGAYFHITVGNVGNVREHLFYTVYHVVLLFIVSVNTDP